MRYCIINTILRLHIDYEIESSGLRSGAIYPYEQKNLTECTQKQGKIRINLFILLKNKVN